MNDPIFDLHLAALNCRRWEKLCLIWQIADTERQIAVVKKRNEEAEVENRRLELEVARLKGYHQGYEDAAKAYGAMLSLMGV